MNNIMEYWHYDYDDMFHRLNLVPIMWDEWDNKIIINEDIIFLNEKYLIQIKIHILDIIEKHKSQIILSNKFEKEKINELPDFIKDLIIL